MSASRCLKRALRSSLLVVVIGGAHQGCGRRAVDEPVGNQYESELLLERREKDIAFKSGPQSPLPDDEKTRFAGLSYFPPNPNLHFRVKLSRYPAPQMIRIGTNTGEIRTGLRYGYFEFQIDGKSCRLQVYRMDEMPAQGGSYLFVPFRDASSGSETYAAGRYIDLRENTSGIYDLDFNRAINPYCAYGKGYSCPVPPEENRLTVAIRAGEKNYAH